MKWQAICRWAACLLSVVLLLLLGRVGEGLLNQLRHFYPARDSDHWVTRFFLMNYPLNGDVFALSLTPFMIVVVGLTIFSGTKHDRIDVFLCGSLIVWLLVGIYFSFLLLALLTPFHLLMGESYHGPVYTAALIVDAVLVFGLGVCAVFRLRHAKKK